MTIENKLDKCTRLDKIKKNVFADNETANNKEYFGG